MTELPDIPKDDLMDIIEMTDKIEVFINTLLEENQVNLGMSALMGASINCMLAQCETLEEILMCRNTFVRILDDCIRNIQIKGPEKPPSAP